MGDLNGGGVSDGKTDFFALNYSPGLADGPGFGVVEGHFPLGDAVVYVGESCHA